MSAIKVRGKVLVLAGSYAEYLEWRKQSQNTRDCQFIESLEDIQGHLGYGVTVVLHGSYRTNPLFKTAQFQALLEQSQSPFSKYIQV
ncbi:MAG: hypothetical protein SFT94_12465 [Pseudanabaenaceae cyanobacterium bins.68]|nr:hypothetical protein [Pseudanabaenaceae cyanobacterium bins.68]